MIRFLVAGAMLLALGGCAKKDDWTAFVFPDQNNIPSAADVEGYVQGKYASFAACQAGAIASLRVSNEQAGTVGDYECGFKCTNRPEMGGLLICKKTAK
jgi:hypothetical protein